MSLVFALRCSSAIVECFGANSQVSRNGLRSTNLRLPHQPVSQQTRGFFGFPRRTVALNGIKGFRTWFESKFSAAMIEVNAGKQQETFDHVLIDVNQLLHVSLRRCHSDDHALFILIRELDLSVALATPTTSLVLAIDGAPPCAKLATQRKRRFSSVVRAEWKLEHFDKFKHRFSRSKRAKKLKTYQSDINTLCLTPGTDFMKRVEDTLLYWSWQRLQRYSNNALAANDVEIFISSSEVAGEGEVKLLDWISLTKPKGSIAIIGGDSDLVLEGLVIPPKWSHNIFVLLPEQKQKFLVVSLWETTRILARYLPHLSPSAILCVRTDMVLLLILNGNDYLPKMRGVGNFDKAFHTYLRLVRDWPDKNAADGTAERHQGPFLVDPDSLDFQVDFAFAFFNRLAEGMQPQQDETERISQQDENVALQQLNTLTATGFMPLPVAFAVIESDGSVGSADQQEQFLESDPAEDSDTSSDQDEVTDDDDDDDEDDDDELDQVCMILTMGDPQSTDFYKYELMYDRDSCQKAAKKKVCIMALEDVMGTGYVSSLGLYDEENDDEEEDGDGVLPASVSTTGYTWEVKYPLDGDADRYLGGLLWNLQTYQDGVCADYGYNYGKRMAPSALEMAEYFEGALSENRRVGRLNVLDDEFRLPISAGISCLAAMPTQKQELVPEPYRSLDSERVEELYADCMDPMDNRFDVKKFERLCIQEVENLTSDQSTGRTNNSPNSDAADRDSGSDDEDDKQIRRKSPTNEIITTDDSWTVFKKEEVRVQHPFEPPSSPFIIKKAGKLRNDPFIRVRRLPVSKYPRRRSVWERDEADASNALRILGKKKFERRPMRNEILHSKFGNHLEKKKSIEDIDFMEAFGSKSARKARPSATPSIPLPLPPPPPPHIPSSKKNEDSAASTSTSPSNAIIAKRMEEYGLQMPPTQPLWTQDGLTAVACLKQLEDAGVFKSISWSSKSPSPSAFAEISPQDFELISLKIVAKKGEEFNWQQDRPSQSVGRQAVRHHLAGLALHDLVRARKSWPELNYSQIKSSIERPPTKPPTRSRKASLSAASSGKVNGAQKNASAESIADTNGEQTKVQQDQIPKSFVTTTDGQAGKSALKILQDTGLVQVVDWKFDPLAASGTDRFERITLVIRLQPFDQNEGVDNVVTYSGDRNIQQMSRRFIEHHVACRALNDLIGRRWSTLSSSELKDGFNEANAPAKK